MRAEVFVGRVDHRLDPRLVDLLDPAGIGIVGRVVQHRSRARRRSCFAQLDAVDHRRRGGDQIEVVFAGQALLDDFQVQQAQEAAAEAKAERGAAFHFEAEAGVVEAQLADAFAQLLKVGGVDREQAAEHHRLDFLEAGQRVRRRRS